jgi:hypothetical protein
MVSAKMLATLKDMKEKTKTPSRNKTKKKKKKKQGRTKQGKTDRRETYIWDCR